MLAAIRKFAKSPFAWGLMLLLIISFGIFGIEHVFTPMTNNAVLTAGSRKVEGPQFKKIFDNKLAEISQQQRRPVTQEEAVAARVHVSLLDEIGATEATLETARRLGVRPSAKLVVERIQEIPAFFDDLTGRFDKARYQSRLGEAGFSVKEFEGGIRDELAYNHLGSALQAGLRAPRAYGALPAIIQNEIRQIDYFYFDAAKMPMPAAPTDAQLITFMNSNAERLRSPELRKLSVVRLSSRALAPTMKVDPAEVQKLYDFRKAAMSRPETRTLVQIPVKDQAQAQTAVTRLRAGEAPATVARALGVQPITYDNKPKTAISDRKVADAAFALAAGQVSAPIQGDLGLAVVRVTGVTPGRTATLEEARPEIEAQLRNDAAAKQIYESVDKYEAAIGRGAAFPDALKEAGLTASTVGPIARQGAPGLSQALVTKAFELAKGGSSEATEEERGEYFIVQVDDIVPPKMPALSEVRSQLTQAYMAVKIREQLKAHVDALLERLRKGETLQAVAASAGAPIRHAEGLTRANAAAQVGALGQELLGQIFGGKPGDAIAGAAPGNGLFIGKIGPVRVGAMPEMAQATEVGRVQISQQLQAQLGEQAMVAARDRIDIRPDVNRARAALGLEPEEKTEAPAPKAAPAKGKTG